MAFIVAAGVLVGGVIAAHSNYSRYSRHSDHSNYSDAAERQRRKKEAKQLELNRSKQRLQEYINGEIQRLQAEYELNGKLPIWDGSKAAWNSFSSDYEQHHKNLNQIIRAQLEEQLKCQIVEHQQNINNIDKMICKINQIQLTK